MAIDYSVKSPENGLPFCARLLSKIGHAPVFSTASRIGTYCIQLGMKNSTRLPLDTPHPCRVACIDSVCCLSSPYVIVRPVAASICNYIYNILITIIMCLSLGHRLPTYIWLYTIKTYTAMSVDLMLF